MTVSQALRAVDDWLDKLILAGAETGTIVHGLGTGKLRDAVHKHLPSLTAVKHFALNELNPGETKVYL